LSDIIAENELTLGTIYFNIYTTLNPGGKIRSNVSVVVPEPATLPLLDTGLAGLTAAVRKWSQARRNGAAL